MQQYGEKKEGVKKQNSEKGFKKNEYACIFCPSGIYRLQAQLGKFKAPKLVLDSKLLKVRKGNAEIPDMPLGLTGIGKPGHHPKNLNFQDSILSSR